MENNSVSVTDKTTCQVCGDKALGFYNFNAITCESCKAFFRRNAFKQSLKCHFVNRCVINQVSRRFCTSCRLKKCFVIGMKKEYILSEEEKVARRNKIEVNREKLIRKHSHNHVRHNSTNNNNNVILSDNFNNKSIISLNNNNINNNENSDISGMDSYSSNSSNESNNECDSTTCTTPDDNLSRDSTKCCEQLNPYEKRKLDELIFAHAAIEPLSPREFAVEQFMDVVKFTDYLIRNIVKMAKRLDSFRKLCQEDQITLLRGGALEIIIMRSAMSLNLETEKWENVGNIHFDSGINLSILKDANEGLYEAHKTFVSAFDPFWRKDFNVMVMIMAIVLFADRPNIFQREIVRDEQQEYINLMRKYITIHVSTTEEADKAFDGLMKQVNHLRSINETHVQVYLDAKPADIGPLLVELFQV